MAVSVLSSGLREDFSLVSARELEERSDGGWERPGHDSWRDPRETESESESEEENMEEPFDGALREEMVADGLSTLGRSAIGTEQVYLHLSVPNQKLKDIQVLSNYVHLQKLDVSGNEIGDLSCVSHMPYLTELNASNNKLCTFFDFAPPKNLMGFYFDRDDVALANFSKFFLELSQKKQEDAAGFLKFQNRRGGRILLQDIKKSEADAWENGAHATECAERLEKILNQALLDLHKVSLDNCDPEMWDFIQSEYLEPEVKLIKKLGDQLTTLRNVKATENGLGEYLFDKLTLGKDSD